MKFSGWYLLIFIMYIVNISMICCHVFSSFLKIEMSFIVAVNVTKKIELLLRLDLEMFIVGREHVFSKVFF